MKNEFEIRVKLSAKEFTLPLVRDILILGNQSPIGSKAMSKALEYLHAHKFEDIKIEDDVIDHVFIRTNILLKASQEKIIKFLVDKVKPIMRANEIIQIEIELETIIEGTI